MFLLVIYFIYSSVYIGEGNGTPLQYSCLENPRDGGAWWAAVYGVPVSRTQLKQLSSRSSYIFVIYSTKSCFLFFLSCAIFCSAYFIWLPWWLRRLSICLQCGRPGFDPWVGKTPWRRKWQSAPVSLPGKSHGQKSLVGCTVHGVTKSQTGLCNEHIHS